MTTTTTPAASAPPDHAELVQAIATSLDNSVCRYMDWEKAEQDFGPFDTGWTSAHGDTLSWWIEEFNVAERIAKDIASANEEDEEEPLAVELAERDAEIAELTAQLERIGKAAMLGAGIADVVQYWSGRKQVAAYTTFSDHWFTQLTPEDLTFMRAVTGISEPNTDLSDSDQAAKGEAVSHE